MNIPRLPRHIAIIMDGNGRWAKARLLPRVAGHKVGVDVVRKIVAASAKHGVEVLTLFAFSSENWQRPQDEVSYLMELLLMVLKQEVKKIHQQNIQLRIIGDRTRFAEKIQAEMQAAETLTANNTGMKVVIAANYGGHWDITQAVRTLALKVAAGELSADSLDATNIETYLSTADLPAPDLLIRTGGEKRISNFLLWQLAYTELFFTDVYWPDFDEAELDKALDFFAARERRFGKTGDQIKANNNA